MFFSPLSNLFAQFRFAHKFHRGVANSPFRFKNDQGILPFFQNGPGHKERLLGADLPVSSQVKAIEYCKAFSKAL